MQLQVYRTNKGIVVKCATGFGYKPSSIFINGKPFSEYNTFGNSDDLILFDSIDDLKITQMMPNARKLQEYRLVNPDLASDKIPLAIPASDVVSEYDEDLERTTWQGQYSGLESLYAPHFVDSGESLKEVEYTVVEKGVWTIEELFTDKPVVRWQSSFDNKVGDVPLNSVVHFDDFAALMMPDFILSNTPCILPAKNLYKIIRAYVQENLDRSRSVITSDYDFCFTVQRKVGIKPIVTRTETKTKKGYSYQTPRFTTKTTTVKQVDLFEMTGSNHAGYTQLSPLKAGSLKEMADIIQNYLKQLIEELNAEVAECECCKGAGIIYKKIGIPKQV